MVKIAPSILSADFACLGREIDSVCRGGADYLHFDVMDGNFVPNLSIGLPVLESVRRATELTLDVHLMIDRPVRYVERFCQAGADLVSFHVEAQPEADSHRALQLIREAGKRCAIALKPKTPAEAAEPFLDEVDMLLVMTVEPGFGGQRFMADMLPKIAALRRRMEEKALTCELEVDGGINPETARLAVQAGADVLVAGSDVFKAADRAARIAAIRG